MLILAVLSALTDSQASQAGDRLHIVTMGSSLTKGGEWQSALVYTLRECAAPGASATMIAKVGANSDWGFSAIEVTIGERPDIVIMEFAVNDADWWDGVSRERARANAVSMISALRESNPQVRIILMSMNPVLGWRSWLRWRLGDYYADLDEVAAQQRVEFVDLEKRWLALPAKELEEGIPDGIHPKPELARRVVVPALAEAIGGVACTAR